MSASNLQLAVTDAKVIVGPVIGKVTNNTARVLVEVDASVEVTCKLERANHEGGCIYKSKALKKGIPGIFVFENLEPSTAYNVSFPNCSNHSERTGHFRTLESQFTNMTFVSLSCNCLGEPEEPVVWNDLIDRYIRPGRVDTVIHLGDQVYADHAFTEGMKLIKSIRHAKEGHHEPQQTQSEQHHEHHEHHHHHEAVQLTDEQKHQIAEGYRDFYRRTWNYPPTREVLSSVANLMLWDDHDIRNDWGTHSTDSDPNSDEYQVGLMARQVYWEYQRQLWDDILEKDPHSITMEGHYHRFEQVGVLFVDTRGSRSFYKDDDKRHSYISGTQWQAIQQSLGPQGIFHDIKNLIVVFSVALCCVGPQMAKLTSNALKDKVGFGLHVHEQIDLVKTFHHWKTEKADREIVLLGGDLHMAVETHIKFHNDVVLHQYITSPIRQHAPPSIALSYTKSIMNVQEEIGEGYTFRHVVFKPKRNFGIIQINASAAPNMKTFIYYQTKKNKSKEVFHSKYNDGELVITKISGKDLVSKDDNGLSDPYVKFNICDVHTKTPVLLKTLNPTWGEMSLSLTLNQDIYQHMLHKDDHPTLKLEVWDYDRVGPHDPMGIAAVSLHDFLLARDNFETRTKTFTVDLQAKHKERVSGSVSFELKFRPLS